MSEAEKKKLIEDMREYSKKVASSDVQAKKLLAKTGMYTSRGKLKSAYK
jgi:hypothetical protein